MAGTASAQAQQDVYESKLVSKSVKAVGYKVGGWNLKDADWATHILVAKHRHKSTNSAAPPGRLTPVVRGQTTIRTRFS